MYAAYAYNWFLYGFIEGLDYYNNTKYCITSLSQLCIKCYLKKNL